MCSLKVFRLYFPACKQVSLFFSNEKSSISIPWCFFNASFFFLHFWTFYFIKIHTHGNTIFQKARLWRRKVLGLSGEPVIYRQSWYRLTSFFSSLHSKKLPWVRESRSSSRENNRQKTYHTLVHVFLDLVRHIFARVSHRHLFFFFTLFEIYIRNSWKNRVS